MRVGLTGASGLLGVALTRELLARGDDVVAFVRPSSPSTATPVIPWDPAQRRVDDVAWRRAGRLDVVVNLAGAGIGDRRWTPSRRREILTSRTGATTFMVELLAGDGARTALVNASAIGFYGSRASQTLDESCAAGTGFLADVCVKWEAAAAAYAGAGGRVTTVRTGIVLDRRGGALARQLPLFRWGLGGRLGPGTQWVSPISLTDHARALVHVMTHALAGPVNLVAPTPTTNGAFTRVLARELRRPAALSVPAVALRAVLGRDMADELLLTSQRVVPGALEGSGFEFRHGDVEAVVRAALA